jgi:alkylhydroperoxidase family enzyme
MDSKYSDKLEELRSRLLERPGMLDPAVRQAAAKGADLAPELAQYVDTVRRHAYRVTDEDIQALLDAGYSEDQVFELTVAAAYGAARDRLDAGLDAIRSHGLEVDP